MRAGTAASGYLNCGDCPLLLTEEAVEEAVRNCELVNRREQEEEDTVDHGLAPSR